MSPLSSEANGSWSFHSGCCGASAFTRSRAKTSWKYIGCSAQSVPSLSKMAMRSAGGTKSGLPALVTFSTKSTMDCLAAPSFQDGSGSAACAASASRRASQSGERTPAMDSRISGRLPWTRRDPVSAEGTGPHPAGGCGPASSARCPAAARHASLPALLITASITRSRLKLPGFWRGGNSLKLCSHWPT